MQSRLESIYKHMVTIAKMISACKVVNWILFHKRPTGWACIGRIYETGPIRSTIIHCHFVLDRSTYFPILPHVLCMVDPVIQKFYLLSIVDVFMRSQNWYWIN